MREQAADEGRVGVRAPAHMSVSLLPGTVTCKPHEPPST